jgi:dienelactone hydrolase
MIRHDQSNAALVILLALFAPLTVVTTGYAAEPETLPNTKPLTVTGDVASRMIDGVDRFLLRELERSVARRAQHWNRDTSSPTAYNASIEPNRQRLAHILGVRDDRVDFAHPELISTTVHSALVAKGPGFDVYAIRWPSVRGMHGEGLMLVPSNGKPLADIVAIPDASQTPEQLVGLTPGVPAASQFPRHLAAAGCRVIVPSLISRDMQRRGPPGRRGRANLTHREYVYRAAFEMGRHLIGYELQKVLACVDWFSKVRDHPLTIGVIGYGEGGMLALYAGALDPRIDGVCVSGHFGSRQNCWNEPLDRNVFGLLEQFGDAEIASMLATRVLVVDSTPGPDVTLPSEGGGPATMRWHTPQAIVAERQRLFELIGDLKLDTKKPAVTKFAVNVEPTPAFCNVATLKTFLSLLELDDVRIPAKDVPLTAIRGKFETRARLTRQIREMDEHSQWLLRESPFVRREFMKKLDTSSLEKYAASVEDYRDFFRHEVIGHFDQPLLPADPRSRKMYDEAKWTGYEVMLNVFPDVFAHGILCLPKDLKPNDKRPVVVCQHGLEGRPTDVVTGDHRAYHDFASKLAERGFITFAPQNIYIFKDRFRTLQRKANPLKKTLFSVMVPQHQQIVNWLKTLPNVDPDRIAFYGLSYGGKSAMRIPPLVTDYCLSICSADFNEWVLKNASTRHHFSYMWTPEYEIFEFDLGSTFNYSEMAALICPRPFMVERGHFDGVGEDQWVAHEFAKVRNLYQARLGIGDRTEIEWFVGPHTINGQGTYDFLHRHLNWPKPR